MYLNLLKTLALARCLQSISALPVDSSPQPNERVVVKTTTSPSGQVIDWVSRESQGNIASSPPLPHRKRTIGNKVQPKPKPMLSGDDVEVGPEGTVPMARLNTTKPLAKKMLPNTSLPTKNSQFTCGNNTDPDAATSYDGVHWYASSAQAVNSLGGQGTFSMYDAYVENPSDFSLLQTAVIRYNVPVAGSGSTTTQTVEAGWINYPDQISAPHLFTFFTTNGYSADGANIGGWNTDQAGWVQVDSTIFPGTEFTPLSTIGGAQYELEIEYLLYEGNWWLYVIDRWIGYYPASLFTIGGVNSADTLQTMSSQINFYGEIFNSETSETTTDMGSGEFPSTGFGYSGYIHSIAYTDTAGTSQSYVGAAQIIISDSTRYSMNTDFNSGTTWGSYLYLGGPGAGGVVNG